MSITSTRSNMLLNAFLGNNGGDGTIIGGAKPPLEQQKDAVDEEKLRALLLNAWNIGLACAIAGQQQPENDKTLLSNILRRR